MNVEGAVERLARLVATAGNRRVILGIVGEPGSGKSTLTTLLAARAASQGISVGTLPMDGFHLADIALEGRGLRQRKGAIETFDAHGYLSILQRVRADGPAPVYAPMFERVLEQPIAGALPILPEHRLVITEGNYLLDASEPWCAVGSLLDETWAVSVDDDLRRSRLEARHMQFGKTADEARAWIACVDDVNARRIRARLSHADAVVEL